MSEVTRGSDKLKQTCHGLRELSAAEVSTVAGGSSYLYYFPKGIPWPEIINPINVNPIVKPVLKF